MNESKEHEYLHVALQAAEQAAVVLRRYFRRPIEVRTKSDQSPVTSADHEAQEAILSMLRAAYPQHSFLAEEQDPEPLGEFVWTIDPLDGTKNFVRGIPLFSIEIALFHDNTPVLGVSHMPLMNELLYGLVDEGAFLNGERVRVSRIDRLSNAAISFGGLKYFEDSNRLAGAKHLFRRAHHARLFGDAYPYHLVSSGRLEATLEARVSPWDVAACAAIVRAAGGTCTDFDGRPFGIESHQIVCSNGLLHEDLLSALKNSG